MKSFAEGRLAVTPVHSELTPSMEGSIVLAPVGGFISPYKLDNTEETRGMPMVLKSVQLQDLTNPSNEEEFKKWLTTHRPSMIHSVKIEVTGYHTSFSGIILLTIPVSVWVCLRGDLAYSFVRFITSGNLVDSSLGLAQRPRYPGVENLPPETPSSSSYSKPLR